METIASIDTPDLAGASTITLIIHGIGDHKSGDILNSVEKAYRNYVFGIDLDFVPPEKIDLSRMLPVNHDENLTLFALLIRLPGKTHLVGAIDWSRTRERLEAKDRNLSKKTVLRRTASAVESLRSIVVDLIYLLRPRSWQLSQPWVRVCAVVLLEGCLIYGFCLFGALLGSTVVQGFGYDKHAVEWLLQIAPCIWRDKIACFAYVILLGLLPFIALKFLVAWDLLEDVLGYVTHETRRRELMDTLSHTISSVDDARAGAHLILIGHSLGSVLLSHSVPHLKSGASVLVTCGSPLGLMANAFPQVVSSCRALAAEILTKSGVRHWVNLHRDADYVGRSLRIAPFENFSERSIGDGGHTDYFSDQIFWRAVLNVVVTQPAPPSSVSGRSPELMERDSRELSDLRLLVKFTPWMGLLAMTLVVFLIRNYVWTKGSLSLLCLSAPFVWFSLAAASVSNGSAVRDPCCAKCSPKADRSCHSTGT